MFLAAAPYFQHRFQSDHWIESHFQPAEVSVSSVTNLCTMTILSKMQKNASYPKRITTALAIFLVCFIFLALSTLIQMSAAAYFGLLLIANFTASLGTALLQNGLFAFAAGFGQPAYTQAIMTGQGVAGVLPSLVQIISVATIPARRPGEADETTESPKAAFVYFITAAVISAVSLLAFMFLMRQEQKFRRLHALSKSTRQGNAEGDATPPGSYQDSAGSARVSIPLLTLFQKLRYLSVAVFLCFAVTMVFPVFTAFIQSVGKIDATIFVPLSFLLWNLGDLFGRMVTISPRVSLTHYPFALFCLAMARLIFIPLYFLCNIKGRGAIVSSDFFYLVVVQLLFGLTNGYLGSQCMMGAGDWVLPEEREAAGGFMGLMLVGGLTAGSLFSFSFGGV